MSFACFVVKNALPVVMSFEFAEADQHRHVSIEPAHITDIDEIVALENRAYQYPWSRPVLLSELNGEDFSYVYVARLYDNAHPAGKIIGYHFFWVVTDEVHILNLAVDPDFQGQGLGKTLLNFGIEFGRERGATCVLLEVRVSNAPALTLYRASGFLEIGLRKGYYSESKEDAYVMKKELLS